MRIISGKYRGRKLKSPPSLQTRPTSDRLREALFNILASRIAGARFLDLCAGSGAVGIEALSRGAAHVAFVDRSRKMYALIETNLKVLNVSDESEVVSKEALQFLRRHARNQGGAFDIIFFDPPYDSDYSIVLHDFRQPGEKLLRDDGRLIVEHHSKNGLPDTLGELRRWRLLKQGETCLSFYEQN